MQRLKKIRILPQFFPTRTTLGVMPKPVNRKLAESREDNAQLFLRKREDRLHANGGAKFHLAGRGSHRGM